MQHMEKRETTTVGIIATRDAAPTSAGSILAASRHDRGGLPGRTFQAAEEAMRESPSRLRVQAARFLVVVGSAILVLPPSHAEEGPAEHEFEGPEILRARAQWFADRHRGP